MGSACSSDEELQDDCPQTAYQQRFSVYMYILIKYNKLNLLGTKYFNNI